MGDLKERTEPVKYIVTREQKRYIAKQNMKKEGLKNFCKHSYLTFRRGNFIQYTRTPSYFAEHWKEYVDKKES